MPNIKLQSLDGKVFEIDVEILKQSKFMNNMFELLGEGEDEDENPLILPNVDAATLDKVIQWCTYHKVGEIRCYFY